MFLYFDQRKEQFFKNLLSNALFNNLSNHCGVLNTATRLIFCAINMITSLRFSSAEGITLKSCPFFQ